MKNKLTEILPYIRKDRLLNTAEKLILIFIVNSKNVGNTPTIKGLSEEAGLTIQQTRKALENLIKKEWYNQSTEEKNNLEKTIRIPQRLKKTGQENFYQQPGSKIARKWPQFFGTRQLTPSDLNKILSFIEDGISEDVIIEVMKITSEKARGNPISYMNKILNNYLEQGIKTLDDLEQLRKESCGNERQIQGNNRAEKEREKLYNLQELKKRGWNE